MILSLTAVLVGGIVAGAGIDELLRGRDPRSRRVMVGGIIGAIAGLIVGRAIGNDGALLDVLAAFLGAALVAFATRVRTSAALGRAA
jgi:uncharacterized membrane protein YeaQ/YmgE (transglycosylase-associated protein family)